MDRESADASATQETYSFETEFQANGALWEERVVLPGGSVEFGSADASANDGYLAVLRFPGDTAADSADSAGPSYVTQISTLERFHFGIFRTRVQFGDCAAGEEVASAALGYFSDGSDQDGDLIEDDFEIDVQSLCGTPSLLYLSVYTDYQIDPDGTERFQKLTRVVDFATGDLFDTPSAESYELVASGNRPELRRPEFPEPSAYYELGFEWHADALRFFIVLGGVEQSLWELGDPERIPQEPVHFLYNLWHPETHWFPATGNADFPVEDVTLRVDWLRISAE